MRINEVGKMTSLRNFDENYTDKIVYKLYDLIKYNIKYKVVSSE